MSTNYYMMTQDKTFVRKYFPNEYEIVDEPYLGYEIHIGKRSAGWKPLFARHDKAYKSVREMKEFIKEHEDYIRIFDEYEREYNLEELEKELIDWGENQPSTYINFSLTGVNNAISRFTNQFINNSKKEVNIITPMDHLMYEKLTNGIVSQLYSRDEDGYNFMKGEFC